MSMLAERKIKTKWSINPRGNTWTNDTNKFGQKMLEKMGWQQGKGLGAKEDGIKEQIKVSYKNNSQGVGYKDTGEQWTEHESKFSELLESLGGTVNPEDIKLNSLEKKSQTSRARVHYHKFTRGKDLSKYSEKDLANIFGKRKLSEVKKDDSLETEPDKDKKADAKKNTFLFNGGSMHDYFKKKLSNFGNANCDADNNFIKDHSESDDDIRPTFGFGFKTDNCKEEDSIKSTFVSYIQEETVKRKAESHLENDILSPKKKMKKEKLKDNENLGLSNPAFNPMATPVRVTKHPLSIIEEISEISDMIVENNEFDCSANQNSVEKKVKTKKKVKKENENTVLNNSVGALEVHDNQVKKKKKKLKNTDLGISNPLFESNVANNPDHCENLTQASEFEIKRVKKSKKKFIDKENEFQIPNHETVETETYGENVGIDFVNEDVINPFEVKIKKKMKKKTTEHDENVSGLSNPNFEDTIEEESLNTLEQNVNEKKKKKRKQAHKESKTKFSIVNPCFNDEAVQQVVIIEEQTVNEKKKKRKKGDNKESESNFSLENPCFNDDSIVQQVADIELNPYEVKRTKKKKSKKRQEVSSSDVDNSIDNSINLSTENDISEDNFDLMLNISSEPRVTKATKEIEKLGSIVKVKSKRRKSVRFSDVTLEHIIPNNDELKEMEYLYENGIDNENFDSIQTHVSENLETISKQLDMFQAEIENDINEKKVTTFEEIMVGEVGNPDGENEKLPRSTRLKFKYANFDTNTPMYQLNKTGPKKSYKHLIKGDILLQFNNTNLHEIKGYGTVRQK